LFFDKKALSFYIRAFMSVPGSVKPTEFARAAESLRGSLAVIEMPRLRDIVVIYPAQAADENKVDYAIEGEVTERGHEALRLAVKGRLWLTCQRCLEPLSVSIETSRRIILAPDADAVEAEYDAEDTDVVDTQESINLGELIEDEVLLSVPLSPRHDTESCGLKIAPQEPVRESPFAVLAGRGRKSEGK